MLLERRGIDHEVGFTHRHGQNPSSEDRFLQPARNGFDFR
jgi:hypothetical protein